MTYLVLARKWRPQRFEEIVGQGHVTRILKNAITSNRIAHAYLFTGVRGVGKTSAARILAKALNCEKGPTAEPCNGCTHCREIMEGNSIDVFEIDGASNRGIDEVRQIIENIRYQPAKSRFKIYIIDEVHQVTKEAFNALLKTLEEPPPFVKFILATTEPHRLPETILSRCQRMDFRRIPVRQLVQRLHEIVTNEGLPISQGALLQLARESGGSMRDAQSLLEQVLSFAVSGKGGEDEPVEVDEVLLQEILGMTERNVLYELSEAVIRGDARRCVELLDAVLMRGLDVNRFSRELVEHFRNLLVARLLTDQQRDVQNPATPLNSAGSLLELPDQEIQDLLRQAADISVDTLADYFQFMAEGDEWVGRSHYPRFALETTLVRLASLPRLVPVGEMVRRLEELEKRLGSGGRGKRQPGEPMKAETDEKELREESQTAPSSGASKEETWRKFVAFVMTQKKFLASHLERVLPLEFEGGRMSLGVGDRHHLNYLEDSENISTLQDLARRFFSKEVAISFSPVLSATREGSPPPAEPASSSSASSGQEDSMVQEALRIFGGSIKEVHKRERD